MQQEARENIARLNRDVALPPIGEETHVEGYGAMRNRDWPVYKFDGIKKRSVPNGHADASCSMPATRACEADPRQPLLGVPSEAFSRRDHVRPNRLRPGTRNACLGIHSEQQPAQPRGVDPLAVW